MDEAHRERRNYVLRTTAALHREAASRHGDAAVRFDRLGRPEHAYRERESARRALGRALADEFAVID